MMNRSVRWSLLSLLAAFAAQSQAALVCTSGNAIGAGSCAEVVTVGPIGTTSFSNRSLSFDLWQSSAGLGFFETLQDVRFTFGGTVHYDATLENFAQSTKSGGMALTEVFDFSRASGPAGFLSSDVTSTGQDGFVFVLSSHQTIPIQIDGTLADVAVVYATGLDEYSGTGTFQALVSGSFGSAFTSNAAQLAEVVLQSKSNGSYGTASPTVTVTYDFWTSTAPVPEPAAWVLVATGLFATGILRRRRRSSSS